MTKRSEWIIVLQRCLEEFVKTYPEGKNDIKEECLKEVREIIGSAVSAARKSAGNINHNVSLILTGLNAIQDPTAEEVRCLSETLGGMFYYVDRRLSTMAVKAGLKATYRPEISQALGYIKEIENEAVDFIKGYTGKESLDSVITTIKEVGERL